MTERRATITRSWRPPAPARRLDDFVEVAAEPEQQPEPTRLVERRDIESRMQNWVRWCSTWGGYPRGNEDSAARAIRVAFEAKYGCTSSASEERRQIDEQDAMLIESCWRKLPTVQREILKLHYVRRRAWFDICRIVGVKVSKRGFAERLAEAQAAIECLIGKSEEVQG